MLDEDTSGEWRAQSGKQVGIACGQAAHNAWHSCVQVGLLIHSLFRTAVGLGINYGLYPSLYTICTQQYAIYFYRFISVNYSLCPQYTGPIITTTNLKLINRNI